MAEINAALAAIRAPLPEVPAPSPATATTAGVEAAGSSRPVGCATVVAIAAVVVAATIAVVVALSSGDDPRQASRTTAPATQQPPWNEPALPRDASPLATNQWQQSEAAASCPLLVPLGADAGGTTRALPVERGWGVSWGRPNEEELFGVTARLPSGQRGRTQVEAVLRWTDGSTAVLHRDGNRLVADLAIDGVDCRYGVFSTLGFDHLAEVLGALRFVRT
jgi:hypothetical protein